MIMKKPIIIGIALALFVLAIPALVGSLSWGISFWALYSCSVFGSALMSLLTGAIDMINYRNAKKKI